MKKTFRLQYVQNSPYKEEQGLRWLDQPEFYPISLFDKKGLYLMGHDLLEHFAFNDGSEEAELFAVGAMVRVRLEGLYFQQVDVPVMQTKSDKDILEDTLSIDFSNIITNWEERRHPSGYFKEKAEQANQESISNPIFHEVEQSLIQSQGEEHADKVKSLMGFVRLGYLMAIEHYNNIAPEQLVRTYKAITRCLESASEFKDELQYSNWIELEIDFEECESEMKFSTWSLDEEENEVELIETISS